MNDLAGTVERLCVLRPEHPHAYVVHVGVPAEPGWSPLADIDADETARWCVRARIRDNPAGLASVAATAVAGALTHAVLGRVTAALVLERRAWDVHATHLAVHRDADGAIDRVAVRDASVLVLPDDPAAAPGSRSSPTSPRCWTAWRPRPWPPSPRSSTPSAPPRGTASSRCGTARPTPCSERPGTC